MIQTEPDFAALRPEWQNLLARSPANNFFLSWEWCFVWWQQFGRKKNLKLIAVWETTTLLGLAPLFEKMSGNHSTLQLLGTNRVASDFLDFIVDNRHLDDVYQIIFNFLDTQPWEMLMLDDLPENSLTNQKIVTWCRERKYIQKILRTERCPQIVLPGHYSHFLESLGHRTRRNIRAFERRLKQEFQVQFDFLRGERVTPEALNQVFELHQRRQQQKCKFSPFVNQRPFHHELLRQLAPSGLVALCRMLFRGKLVAGLYLFDDGQRFYLYQGGFDAKFAPKSVNRMLVLVARCVEQAISENRLSLELLRGETLFKKRIANQIQVNHTVWIARSPRARRHLLMTIGLMKIKALAKKIVPVSLWEKARAVCLRN